MRGRWLTPRECEVLIGLAKGESFKGIAGQLDISENTAKSAALRAYRKLGVRDRFEAVAIHPIHSVTPTRLCNRRRTRNAPSNGVPAPATT